MSNIIKRVWNQNRMVTIEDLRGMAFQAESGGHTFEISGINDANEAVSLSGTVAGVFMRPDGTDVALTGSASDGVVSVTLSDACYAVAGRFGLTIFVTADSKKTCVYACIGTVAQTSYGTVAGDTPQDVVDLINAINAAIASIPADYTDLLDSIAPSFSDSTAYASGTIVWYNGVLYQFTADKAAGSWDATKARQISVTTGQANTENLADGAVTMPKLGADVLEELDNKANIDGSYESMTVGNAEQIVSSVGIADETPYNFRTSGGSVDIGDRETVNAVVGGTVCWNQLTQIRNVTSYGITASFADGEFTLSGTANANYAVVFLPQQTVKDHIYLRTVTVTANPNNVSFYASLLNVGWSTGKNMCKASRSANSNNGISVTNGVDYTGVKFKYNLHDLTQMFGSTIADYIYSLEQATAGAGMARFRNLFPKNYYAYNAGELLSVQTSAHKMVGFNAYNPETGTAKVVGGNQYQITGAYTALSLDGASITPDANGYFTPSANGELTVTGGNSTTTCVHLVWDGERDGEYEPYVANEYPLDDSLTLRGILKLDANNNLYADGDRYLPDGTVERRFAERSYQSGDESLSDVITDGTTTVYKLTTPTTETADHYTQTQIVDDFGTEEFVDAAVEANERDVAIPVGNETVYKPNLRAKLEMAPDSPDGDGDYIVRQTNGENAYIPLVEVKELPDMPSEDGNYTLRCTVTNGTATLSWVSA